MLLVPFRVPGHVDATPIPTNFVNIVDRASRPNVQPSNPFALVVRRAMGMNWVLVRMMVRIVISLLLLLVVLVMLQIMLLSAMWVVGK